MAARQALIFQQPGGPPLKIQLWKMDGSIAFACVQGRSYVAETPTPFLSVQRRVIHVLVCQPLPEDAAALP